MQLERLAAQLDYPDLNQRNVINGPLNKLAQFLDRIMVIQTTKVPALLTHRWTIQYTRSFLSWTRRRFISASFFTVSIAGRNIGSPILVICLIGYSTIRRHRYWTSNFLANFRSFLKNFKVQDNDHFLPSHVITLIFFDLENAVFFQHSIIYIAIKLRC